jgi:hypothetical protein
MTPVNNDVGGRTMVLHKVEIVTLKDIDGWAKGRRELAEDVKKKCEEAAAALGWGLVATLTLDPSSAGSSDSPATFLIFAEAR